MASIYRLVRRKLGDALLAEDVPGPRYEAATAAALAGSSQGEDAGPLDDKERARWRRQALSWLRQDLAALEARRECPP